MTYTHIENRSHRSITRWHIAAILVAACVCVFLAYASQLTDRKHRFASELELMVSELNAQTNVRSWLVGIHRALPTLELIRPEQAENVSERLDALTRNVTQGKALDRREQLVLHQALLAAHADLKVMKQRLDAQRASYTHSFYWSLLLLVGLLFVGLRRRPARPDYSPLAQYLGDAFLFPRAPVALALSDHNDRTIRANQAYEKATGYEEAELHGRLVFDQDPEGMRTSLRETGIWAGEQRLRRKDGSEFSEKVVRMALGDRFAPEGFLTMSLESVIPDEERRLMLWQAHHDNLTKLPNSNLLEERLIRGLAGLNDNKTDQVGTLISIDIDGFRKVNDSVGHALADRVLTEAAMRIAMCARESDTVARIGGDLFMIAAFDIGSVAEAEMIARSAVESFAVPIVLDDQEVFLTASAGVVIFPDDGTEKGELSQKADAARMDAKKQGGNRIAFFEQSMNSDAARRLDIEMNLRKAIAQEELALHYQPIIDVENDRVYGAEALLRWHNSELGFVSPGEFIPVAESSGMIVELGGWVINEVQRQIKAWQAQPDWPKLCISLNVSAKQFSSEEDAVCLLGALSADFKEHITIELTESALVTDDPGASCFLQGAKQQGFRMALDDFGTGYSSVGYLRDFDFDLLKIDKSFIEDLDNLRADGLVASIVAMGRVLGLKIVAEGVEDDAQAQCLKRIGCDFIQGYMYSRPLPVSEFEAFVRNR